MNLQYVIVNLLPCIHPLTFQILNQTIRIFSILKRISAPKMHSLVIVIPIQYHVLIAHYLIDALHSILELDLLLSHGPFLDVIEVEALIHLAEIEVEEVESIPVDFRHIEDFISGFYLLDCLS